MSGDQGSDENCWESCAELCRKKKAGADIDKMARFFRRLAQFPLTRPLRACASPRGSFSRRRVLRGTPLTRATRDFRRPRSDARSHAALRFFRDLASGNRRVQFSVTPPPSRPHDRVLPDTMLKRKLKQWLGENAPGPGVSVKTETEVPGCATPPLPSASAVNRYPSLKTKLLGPKMEPQHGHGSPESRKENGAGDGNEGAYTSPYASTSNLAAAAAFATGLPCGKKMEDSEKFKPQSPTRLARMQTSGEGSDRCESPKPNNAGAGTGRQKPLTPKPSRVKPSPSKPARPQNSGGSLPGSSDDAGSDEPVPETDEEVARRLHQEFNCAPVRQSRGRNAREFVAEQATDEVHGTDPGILPSC